MDKEKVIEVLKMIESACISMDCNNCPFYEIDNGCNFRNVMFVPPYKWNLNFFTAKEN